MKMKGQIRYNKKLIKYELRGKGYSKSLFMKRGKGRWEHQGGVHPSISYNAMKQYAKQFLK